MSSLTMKRAPLGVQLLFYPQGNGMHNSYYFATRFLSIFINNANLFTLSKSPRHVWLLATTIPSSGKTCIVPSTCKYRTTRCGRCYAGDQEKFFSWTKSLFYSSSSGGGHVEKVDGNVLPPTHYSVEFNAMDCADAEIDETKIIREENDFDDFDDDEDDNDDDDDDDDTDEKKNALKRVKNSLETTIISSSEQHHYACATNVVKARKVPKKVPIILNEDDIEEHFAKGGGKGGQKINKTSSKVHLHHKPTGLRVACQEFRELSANRKRARTVLKGKLDDLLNGELSKRALKIKKIQKKKSKNGGKKAYAVGSGGGIASETMATGDKFKEIEVGEVILSSPESPVKPAAT